MNKIGSIPVGVAADLIATKEGFSKAILDEFALKSIEKAVTAQTKDQFKKSIIPIYDQNNIAILKTDETINGEIEIETLNETQPFYPQVDRFGFEAIALQKYPLVEQIIPVHSRANRAAGADSAALILLGNKIKGRH